jgi:hypothetical protein
MIQEPETPKHRKRKPTGKKKFGVLYKYLGPPTDHFLRQDSTEWFVTLAAAEQSLQRWIDGRNGFASSFRRRDSWTAEIVRR